MLPRPQALPKKAADESVAANIAAIEKMQADVASKQTATAASEKAAAASAVAAAGSATQAEAQKTAAAKAASDAQGYMQAASSAATAAAASATTASAKATEAADSASAAATSEQAAAQAAEIAQQVAEVLQPEVDQIKDELAKKVPKSDYAPEAKTDAMTQPVGKDSDGKLWTAPGSGGGGIAVSGATVGQTIKISAVDDDGVPTAWEPVDLPSGGAEEWELLTKNAETGEAEPIVMDAETLLYNFPSLADYKKLFILIKKTYVATTGLTGNVWFRYADGTGFLFSPSYKSSYAEIDASLPGMCALKYLSSNNLQTLNYYAGTYTNVESLGSPYWVMPNTDWAEYYANCNTTITICGVRR